MERGISARIRAAPNRGGRLGGGLQGGRLGGGRQGGSSGWVERVFARISAVESFRAAHHEAANDVAEGDVHVLADEDDAVEMVGHQLVVQQADVALAGLPCLCRLLRCQLALDFGNLLPASQHLVA